MSYQAVTPFAMETRRALLSQYVRDQSVLEVGCAEGGLLGEIHEQAKIAVGIDTNHNALVTAHQENMLVARGLPEKIPFAAHTFDTVCAFDVIPHVDAFPDVIREFARVVRPGGHVLVEAYNRLSASYWCHLLLGRRREEGGARFDLLVELKKNQPFELDLVDVLGSQITSPSARVFALPGLRTLWTPLERIAQKTHLRFFGARLILVLRKREDLEYKER